jgi:PAS domain-containing protein
MVEQSLFSMYKEEIPTSKRRFLHNLSLKPLVIVDTNVLVDALVEKMFQRMDLAFETNLDVLGGNRFHHLLRHHASEKRLLLMIPDDVRGELRLIAKDQRLLHRFKGSMINTSTLEQTLDSASMNALVDEVLTEFTTWSPTTEMLAGVPETSEALDDFLRHHAEVFDELTALKALRSVTVRSELDGEAIYPESTDLDIYRLAMHLSSMPLPDIGAVLVATMDGDFTLLDRAIEERFGFGVTKNNRTLKPWLGRQTN